MPRTEPLGGPGNPEGAPRWLGRGPPGRGVAQDHRAAPAGRAAVLRRHRQGGGPVRGGRAPAGAEAARSRGHADRGGHRPAAGRLPPAGDDRPQGRGRPRAGGGQARRHPGGRLRGGVRRLVRPPGRAGLRGRRGPAPPDQRRHPHRPGGARHPELRLPAARQGDLHMGHEMTTTPGTPFEDTSPDPAQAAARRHLWMHFTRMSSYGPDHEVPMIVRGDGPYVYDQRGKRYLDGLSGLFVVQAGHGRSELAEAAAKQASELAYFPLWGYVHPRAVELAERLASIAPGDLNRVFFTTGGSEAVESAWKLARQYFRAVGQPGRYKVLSRHIAYHGTSMGALSITGLADIKN